MRTGTRALIAIMAFLCTFWLPAYAGAESGDTVSEKAGALIRLSLLKGTGGDLNLTAPLKRSEAAAFIVRLLGKEGEVKANVANSSGESFNDVSPEAWYAPYVYFCSGKKLIDGYPDGSFNPGGRISEKEFLKMVLISLGYEYGKDFSWSTLYPQAYIAQLVSGSRYEYDSADNTDFTRGDAVEVLYNALLAEVKDQNTTIIKKLIAEKAISRETALEAGVYKDGTVSAISAVEPYDQDSVRIRLNENVKEVKAGDIQIYETDKKENKLNFTIESQKEGEILLKVPGQAAGRGYTVEIAKVEDLEGNIVKDITGAFTGYTVSEAASDFFKLSRIEPQSKNVINVYFTQPLGVNAEIPTYFEILENGNSFVKGATGTMTVKVLNSNDYCMSIYIKQKAFTRNTRYTLRVNGDLTSKYGVQLNEDNGESIEMDFTGRSNDNELLAVTGVTQVAPRTLLVEFNRDVDPASAQNASNYAIDKTSINVLKAQINDSGDAKGRSVYLCIGQSLADGKSYEMTVKNIADLLRGSSMEQTIYTIYGNNVTDTDLQILSVTAVDNRTLEVYLDRRLDPASAVNSSLYSVTGKTKKGFSPQVKVYYDPSEDPFRVKLYILGNDPLEGEYMYNLRIRSVMKDLVGNISRKDSSFDFSGTSAACGKPVINEALIIGKDTIKLKLSREMAPGGINTVATNYKLKYEEGGVTRYRSPSKAIYIDSTTLILRFGSALDFTKQYTLRFTSLVDYAAVAARTDLDGSNGVEVVVGKD
ncbi:MAG: S-layer homology domain-containing protein [Clostridiales bacterium]|jgi:hypothetical protein|nr:S-layer homology domain-containing protein [Eubacteriales bacterium]MDH7567777.1 S-layer homology domain-containing protein [Clostridiales bacterium]